MGTVSRVVAFVLGEIIFALLATWDAGRHEEGANFGAAMVHMISHPIVALVWAAFDGWRTGQLKPLLARWGIVALSAAITVIVAAGVGYGPIGGAEVLSLLASSGSLFILLIFVPAAVGAFGGTRAARRRGSLFAGPRSVHRPH